MNAKADISKLGHDGFIIEVVKNRAAGQGGDIYIYGTRPRGTMYGVYTLLESLGVRWWTPTVTHIPQRRDVAVEVGRTEETPRLEYRDMMYLESFSVEGKLWAARNKLNGFAWSDTPAELIKKVGGRYRFHGNLVHSYANLLRASGVKIEPEMQALVGGKRSSGQPCLTNQKVLDTITAEVIKIYKKEPDLRFVVVGQNDNNSYCRCPECQKVIDAEGESGPVIQFANQVAERVEKEIPGACITTAAYNWSRVPPKTLRPRHNVYITLCTIECDFGHPLATAKSDVNVKFRENIKIWSKITNKLLIWDYVTNYWGHTLPHPNFDVLLPNIKFLADNGAAGVFEQASHKGGGSDLVQLRMWVLAKGLWNPEGDGWNLIHEFIDGYYGDAAPHIKQYLEIIQNPIRRNPDYAYGIYRYMDTPHLSPEAMADAEVVLRKAAAAVKGDAELEKRVRHAHMGVWYVTLKRGMQSNVWKAIEQKTGQKIDLQQLTDDFVRMTAESHVTMTSDGWGVAVPTVAWATRHAFDERNDFIPGKTYRLMVRAKGTPLEGATGVAWSAGLSTKTADGKTKHFSKRIGVDEMQPDQWKAFEIARWKPQHGDVYWIAHRSPKVMPVVYQDCMWLEPVDE